MDTPLSFRYRTEADRYWHDKVSHPNRCHDGVIVALAILALLLLV